MPQTSSQTAFRSLLYGSGATLLVFDIFFLFRSLFTSNFVPIVPIIAGILTAGGLLFIVYAEQRAREEDKRDHRRISRVAHQLESPLQTLRDDLEYLLTNANKLPAEGRLKVKRMETKTRVLLDNVRDVFLMLQAHEGPLAQEVRTYNLCVILEEVVAQHQQLASAHNVEVIHKAHCEEAPVRADKRLLTIALGHVLENAIVYTLKPGVVNVAITRGQKYTRIIFQDRGVGVAASDRPGIFSPFARGHKAEQYDPDGIGVGLTLARLLVREAGGDIVWRARERATGSEFEVRLPLATGTVSTKSRRRRITKDS